MNNLFYFIFHNANVLVHDCCVLAGNKYLDVHRAAHAHGAARIPRTSHTILHPRGLMNQPS